MGINHRSGLLALFACAAVLCHLAAASSDTPVASKWTKGFDSLDILSSRSSLEPATTAAAAAQQKADAKLATILPSALQPGDIISLLRLPITRFAAPYVFNGNDLKVKGILKLSTPSACKGPKLLPQYNLEQFSLALSRDNILMYACQDSNDVTLWAQTSLASGNITAQFPGVPGDVLRASSIAFANDGTSWAMANGKRAGKDFTYMLNFNQSMQLVNTVQVSPVMTAFGLDGRNNWFEFANGRFIEPLDADHDDPRTFGIDMAVFPNGTDCTAVLPMPDGTTIVGCAGPGNDTNRICAYQIKGGKAIGRRQILNQWCVPAKAPERPLPKDVTRAAEINLALSADRSSFYLNYNDYYQYIFDVVNKHPKWFEISLSGPSTGRAPRWEQIANGTLFTHAVGAAVVVRAIPVSQQDCAPGACCTPEGTFRPNTTLCRAAGGDPCREDAYCSGDSYSGECPANFAEDFTPCSVEPRGLFTAVSGFSGMTTASVGGITPAEAKSKQYMKCNLCFKGHCLPTTTIRKGGKGEDEKEDWVYCK